MKTFIQFSQQTQKQKAHNFWVLLKLSFSCLFKKKPPRLFLQDAEIILERNGVERAALRGGRWGSAASAGVFPLNLSYAPSNSRDYIGFRAALAEF